MVEITFGNTSMKGFLLKSSAGVQDKYNIYNYGHNENKNQQYLQMTKITK